MEGNEGSGLRYGDADSRVTRDMAAAAGRVRARVTHQSVMTHPKI